MGNFSEKQLNVDAQSPNEFLDDDYENGIGTWLTDKVKGLGTDFKNIGKGVKQAATFVGKKAKGFVTTDIKNIGKGIVKVAKAVGLAIPRAAFLGMLRINVWGWASELQKMKTKNPAQYTKARNKWAAIGGNRTTYDKTVEKGSHEKALKIKIGKKKSADGIDNLYFYDVDEPEDMSADAAAASSAAASPSALKQALAFGIAALPVIAIIIPLLTKKGEPTPGMDADTRATIEGNADPAAIAAAEAEVAALKAQGIDTEALAENEGLSTFPTWGYFAIAGGILLIGGIIAIIVIKSKK